MTAAPGLETLHPIDGNGFQDRFGIAPEGLEGWLLYGADEIMNVSELLIARSSDYYTLCFLPDDFLNPYRLSLQPLKMGDGKSLVRGTYFMYRENRSMSRAVREFIRFVKEWYADKDHK